MSLNAKLTKKFPRDFSRIPLSFKKFSAYSGGDKAAECDETKEQTSVLESAALADQFNRDVTERRLDFLIAELDRTLTTAVATRQRPILTSALMPGGNVILDALHRLGLLSAVPVVFIDTFHLFDETLLHLEELQQRYSFKAIVYRAADCADKEEYVEKYGKDFFEKDVEAYDMLCKVEPMNRALREHNSDCWMNGRRRDHGAERSNLVIWEDNKLNPLAFWTFEDCWLYLQRFQVPYHPLHDVGFPSLGDRHSSSRVPLNQWFTFGGERSGRFLNMFNNDGSPKTECGLHTKISTKLVLK